MCIKEPISPFKKGKIYIFATDTAFGIGCRIDDENAIEKLFSLRKRPKDKAVPVLISSIKMAKEYGVFGKKVEDLMKNFWPGGLTIIVKAKKEKVPTLVRGGGETIGLRIPNHEKLLSQISKTGVPILGPSANFAGMPTPYKFEKIDKGLINLVDFVIPGMTKSEKASTVIDTTTSPWKILRQGAITNEKLNLFLKSHSGK